METAWNEGEKWLEQVIDYIEDNMRFVKEYVENNIPKISLELPESTYLLWLDCTKLGMHPQELEEFMVNKAGIGLNNGSNFCRGLEGFMRMNVACPRSMLKKALEQMKDAIQELEK